jgi:hypothetical protein
MTSLTPKTLLVAAAIFTTGTLTALAAPPADTDGNGGGAPVHGAIMFNLLDQNGDGVLDAVELQAVTSAIIAAADADEDGALSQAEFATIMKSMGPRGQHASRGKNGPRHGQHQGRRGDRMSGEERHAMAAKRMGIGEDGLSQADFLERQAERFANLDTNGDGVITADELAAQPRHRGPRAN